MGAKIKKRSKAKVMTKKEACDLLEIKLKDLSLFEYEAKIRNKTMSYTQIEFAQLSRSVARFYGCG